VHVFEFDGATLRSTRSFVLNEGTDKVSALAIHEHLLLKGGVVGQVFVYDLRSRGTVRVVDLECSIWAIEITADGNHIAVGHERGLTILHRTQMHDPQILCRTTRPVKAIAWTPRYPLGTLIYGGGERGSTLIMHSLGTGQSCSRETFAEILGIQCSASSDEVAVSHGDSFVPPDLRGIVNDADDAMSSSAGMVRIYELKRSHIRPISVLRGHTMAAPHMAMSPDNTILVTGGGDGTLRFWSCFPECCSPPAPPPDDFPDADLR
jgi:cell division cycle 20-like protein 1 (cofactor of APC complex)